MSQRNTHPEPAPRPSNIDRCEGEGVAPPIRMFLQWSVEDGDWCLDSNPSPNPKKKAKPIVLEPGSGPRDIEFHLQPPAGKAWTFADPAISADDNCPCPPPDGLNSNQIHNVMFRHHGKPNEDRTVLIVSNRNSDDARLVRYKLHVVDEQGVRLPDCDPAILNGGGGEN